MPFAVKGGSLPNPRHAQIHVTVHFSFNNSLIVKSFDFFAESLSRQTQLLGPDSSRLNLMPRVSLNIYLFRYFYAETGENFLSIHDT